MLLSLRKNGLTSLFKEVRVFKGGGSILVSSVDSVYVYMVFFFAS